MAERHHTLATWRGDRWTFDAKTTTGHTIVMDTAYDSDMDNDPSDDRGPTPIELLLTALAGCASTTVLSILQKKREPVAKLEVRAEGVRAETHPKVYTDIEVTYRVYGAVKPESVERAIELSEDKYCGVSVMLRETAVMTHRFEIITPES